MTLEMTTSTTPSHPALRSIGAVFAGLASIALLSTVADEGLRAAGLYPADSMAPGLFALALGYRSVFGILAGFIAARLAPSHKMRHALILGGIGVVISTIGAVAMWNAGPHWYALGVIAICFPAAALGATLAARR